jgi:hypothetical protein
MLHRSLAFVTSACLCGALLIGCADGGSSATRAAGALPAGAQSASVHAPGGAVRRTQNTPTCSGVGTESFIGGGNGNVADAINAGILTGNMNEVCDQNGAIAGGGLNTISSGANSAYNSFIGGGNTNTITSGAHGAFVGSGNGNTVTGPFSFVVAGASNQNAGTEASLGGGDTNTITSAATDGVLGGGFTNTVSAEYGVIAGGKNNTVSGEGGYIAAGGYNTASGEGAVVDGGFNSTASGTFATIPGGYVNNAAGTYSFAAGARASAANEGAFVWSDGSDGDTILTSSRAYQFLARASGGFTLYTNAASSVGAQLAAGSGTWASLSDRNAKTNIAPLDDAAVLDKVAALPISRWSYKSEHGVRHVGPMAQDFYAAFRVGEDDKHITSIDEDGVALASIKALHAENGALHADNETLHAENALLRRQLAAMKAVQSAHDAHVDAELAHIVAVLRK